MNLFVVTIFAFLGAAVGASRGVHASHQELTVSMLRNATGAAEAHAAVSPIQMADVCNCVATRELVGAGMKRALVVHLSCDAPLAECAARAAAVSVDAGPCHWAVVQPLGRGLFVDPYSSAETDRLSTLRGRAGQVTWQRGSIDIEAAAADAEPGTVTVAPVGLSPAALAATVSLDVTARYHAPQLGGGSLTLTLPAAVAVAICPHAPAVAPAPGLFWASPVSGATGGPGAAAGGTATSGTAPLLFAIPIADSQHLTLVLIYTFTASALALAAVLRAASRPPALRGSTLGLVASTGAAAT